MVSQRTERLADAAWNRRDPPGKGCALARGMWSLSRQQEVLRTGLVAVNPGQAAGPLRRHVLQPLVQSFHASEDVTSSHREATAQ